MQTGLNEKCGIIGVTNSKAFDVSRLVYLGLWALQHRGQDSSGIASFDGRKLHHHRRRGLVSQVYDADSLALLNGQVSVGHNRYSTSGGDDEYLNQPFVYESLGLAFAHNGNLPFTDRLQEYAIQHNLLPADNNDSGLMALALANELKHTHDIVDALRNCWPLFTGAFSCVGFYQDQLYAFRDAQGIRPLVIGKTDHGYVIASETAALDIIGAEYLRDVNPGELVTAQGETLESFVIAPGKEQIDVLEFVYLARPDSRLLGKSVYAARRRAGELLAEVEPVNADTVIGVPDSGIPAATGYAYKAGLPYTHGLIKNRYVGRTFIEPEKIRKKSVELKFNIITEIIKDQRIVLIDDSIVRGNTLKHVVQMLKKHGAKEVHVRIASPPVAYPDFYGIDTPTHNELIAHTQSVEKTKTFINADSLAYLSLDALVESTGLDQSNLCLSSFNGSYPIPVPQLR